MGCGSCLLVLKRGKHKALEPPKGVYSAFYFLILLKLVLWKDRGFFVCLFCMYILIIKIEIHSKSRLLYFKHREGMKQRKRDQ